MSLIYLKFSKGNVFSDHDIYEVYVDNKSLNVVRENFGIEDRIEYRIDDAEDWLQLIDKIHIDKWEDSYVDPDVLDGTQWYLEYEDNKKGYREIGGSNAYPEGYRTKSVDG